MMNWDDEDEAAMLYAEGARAQADAEAANAEAESGAFAIQKLAQHNVELALQLGILIDWLTAHTNSISYGFCRCENNGDLCEFHAMLDDARKAIQ